jgi:hypothetical protein
MRYFFTHLDQNILRIESLPLDIFLNYNKWIEPKAKLVLNSKSNNIEVKAKFDYCPK